MLIYDDIYKAEENAIDEAFSIIKKNKFFTKPQSVKKTDESIRFKSTLVNPAKGTHWGRGINDGFLCRIVINALQNGVLELARLFKVNGCKVEDIKFDDNADEVWGEVSVRLKNWSFVVIEFHSKKKSWKPEDGENNTSIIKNVLFDCVIKEYNF